MCMLVCILPRIIFLVHEKQQLLGLHHEGATTYERVMYPAVFFFQAEDGIRDLTVTGVQTCALPILMITPAMFGPLPQNTLDQNQRPDPSDKVKYGEYLVTLASCSDCHTPMTPQGAPDFSKAFAGGMHFKADFVDVTVANITPDSTTGIGAWTENEFVAKFKSSLAMMEKGDNPGKLNTEMPWPMYAKMKEEDLRAIYAYLRTVPPVKNKVEKWPTK